MAARDDFQEIKRRAEAGDADAQYRLAAALSAAGRRDDAGLWLEQAAAQGHGDALYTLATRTLRSETIDVALAHLSQSEAAGSILAIRLAAVLHASGSGVARDWRAGAVRIAKLARDGVPAAMREAAMVLLANNPDDEDGAALLAASAPQDPVAGLIALRRAAQGRRYADCDLARRTLAMLERASYPEIAELQAAMRTAPVGAGEAAALNWDRAEPRLVAEPATPALASEVLCERPNARIIRSALTRAECDYVIASSARRLAPSMIADPQTGAAMRDAYRTSMTATLALADLDLALVMLARRMAILAGRPPENGESLSVLCYAPGQEYRPHCDWLPPGPELDRGGQRAATALLYLNDAYDGGETRFLTPDVSFKGAPGDLLVFENVLENGDPDPASRHQGLPVTDGRKWLISLWLREKIYRF